MSSHSPSKPDTAADESFSAMHQKFSPHSSDVDEPDFVQQPEAKDDSSQPESPTPSSPSKEPQADSDKRKFATPLKTRNLDTDLADNPSPQCTPRRSGLDADMKQLLSLAASRDELGVARDHMLLGLFESIGGGESECVLSSCALERLSFIHHYDPHQLQGVWESHSEEIAVIVSNLAVYLFPPMITAGDQSVLVCTECQQIALEDIAMLSLPFKYGVSDDGSREFALRTPDWALHLRTGHDIWLRSPQLDVGESGGRSEIADLISEAFMCHTGNVLHVNHMEYGMLQNKVHDGSVWSVVEDTDRREWVSTKPLHQGFVLHRSSQSGAWRRRWCVLSLHDLVYFDSPADFDAYKVLLDTPLRRRASMPVMGWDERVQLSGAMISQQTFPLVPDASVAETSMAGFTVLLKSSSLDDHQVNSFASNDAAVAAEWLRAVTSRVAINRSRMG